MIFDESSFYIPEEVDLLQIIEKFILETTFELTVSNYFSKLQKKDSNSEIKLNNSLQNIQLTEN